MYLDDENKLFFSPYDPSCKRGCKTQSSSEAYVSLDCQLLFSWQLSEENLHVRLLKQSMIIFVWMKNSL